MALMLWLAGAITIFTGHLSLGLVIWGVVLFNAGFSFWREHRAEQAVGMLKHLLPSYARVLRGNAESKIRADEIVPGDILILAEGDIIPADARVVEEYGLRTNNSTLTGEATPARKMADASLREGLTEVERPNLVFAGTSVVSGTGQAVAYATGMLTQFGRIARLTQAVKEAPSLLQQEMVRLSRILSFAALATGLIVFCVGRFEVGMPEAEAFLLAIGIIVAVIPEGLVPTVTLTLAIAVQRLAQKGVLVKKLAAVETLGTTSVICTDKSGTLTQNQMTVVQIWVSGEKRTVNGNGYQPDGDFQPPLPGLSGRSPSATVEDMQSFFTAAMLCNNSRLHPPSAETNQWSFLGDQTEAALLVLALKGGLKEQEAARLYPRIHELPFDARRKRMSTIHRHDGSEVAFVKGAPKEVLQLCTHLQMHGQVIPLDDALRSEILAANDEYARSALRVLALARHALPRRSGAYAAEWVENELVFLGLAAMMDPPRPEVARALKTFNSAGIRLVMITGDYGLTAETFARRVGMLKTRNPRILTGVELDELSDDGLQAILDEEIIFARMAPEHKLRLVNAYQARGEVVTVIGDGVNDAPALRKADVGIVMGQIGTDVAKEAADVVLMQEDFQSIVSAIEEGRAIYDNLRKFITYIFASNVPEVVPFLLTALFKVPLALTVAQILAIDLGTDMLPALALGMEKPEPDVMQRPPRPRSQSLVDMRLFRRAYLWLGAIEASLCTFGFFWVYDTLNHASFSFLNAWFLPGLGAVSPVYLNSLGITVFHAGVVTSQIGNAFACRSEKSYVHRLGWLSNAYLLAGIGVEISLILLMIYLPPLANLFKHVPLPPVYWAGLGLYAPTLYGLERMRKMIVHRLELSKAQPGGNL